MLRPANRPDATCVAGLNKLKSVFERSSLGASPPCNIVFAWHGTPAQYVEAVCRDGPRAFRTTDGGFFGAGSYFAVELEYATRYAMMQVRTHSTAAFYSRVQAAAAARVAGGRGILKSAENGDGVSVLCHVIADADAVNKRDGWR
jgi:hypothetical protein